jgi:hypothetical protein
MGIRAEAMFRKRLPYTNLSFDQKFYAGQNARITTIPLWNIAFGAV